MVSSIHKHKKLIVGLVVVVLGILVFIGLSNYPQPVYISNDIDQAVLVTSCTSTSPQTIDPNKTIWITPQSTKTGMQCSVHREKQLPNSDWYLGCLSIPVNSEGQTFKVSAMDAHVPENRCGK